MNKYIWLVIVLGLIIVILTAVIFLLPNNKTNNPAEVLDIKNLSVKEGDIISSPLVVEGEARGTWFFEASFPIKITDEQGNILGTSFVQAQSDWMTENFVPFKGEINFVSNTEQKGFLILMRDNPSGLPQGDKEIKIPVVVRSTGTMKIKVYLNNNNLDPEISCNKVFFVERVVPRTEGVARAAIEELLKGPTANEKVQGYSTSINTGVQIQSLTIENGTAKIDFNDQLEFQVGGSCMVSAIRSQITETLKQFSTVKNVIISIDGRTEDILQP
jgi:hypothetical protein